MKIQLKILNKEFYQFLGNWVYPEGRCDPIYNQLPDYATGGSVGIDLVCTEDVTIPSGEVQVINTGLAVWTGSASEGFTTGASRIAALILPRSGLGTKGLVLANTVGVIDSDYQGELIVQAWNRNKPVAYEHPTGTIDLQAGTRFAQLLFVPVFRPQFDIVEEFSSVTDRSAGGFGSTGQ